MKEMPAVVTHMIEDHLLFVLAWCSHYLYERLLPRWQEEPLVQCQQVINFTPIAQACAAYHQRQGGQPGRPISHSVTKMVRVLYLMYQENCSYRQTESRLRRDLLWRWFAGYTLFETVPDHNTIYLFDQYVRQHQPRLYFDTILQQIDSQDPTARNRGQIADTFAVLAALWRRFFCPPNKEGIFALLRAQTQKRRYVTMARIKRIWGLMRL